MQAITERTFLPVSLLVLLLSTAVGGAWWASALFARVSYAEDNIGHLEQSNKEVVKQLQIVNETLVQIRTTLDNKTKR